MSQQPRKKEKILMSWSGGKDSALALHEILKAEEYEVVSLLTTITEEYDRISMHGIRRQLLEQQAESLAIPLHIIFITPKADNEYYEKQLTDSLNTFASQEVTGVAFGDLFLEDLKKYREEKMATCNMKAIFPLWKKNTKELAKNFIRQGFKAVLACVDTEQLDKSFTGRLYDESLLKDLPEKVDPCGENGEFHTFVYEAPIYKQKINYTKGPQELRENQFNYQDLLPQ